MNLSYPAVAVALSDSERINLEALLRCRSGEIRLLQRAQIILLAGDGFSNQSIARRTAHSRTTIALWRNRFVSRRQARPELPASSHLHDEIRIGSPGFLTAEEYVELFALATADPSSLGLPFTHWTHEELARYATENGRIRRISPSHVGRLLKSADLQPHRVQEWMNRPADPEFDRRREQVTHTLADAVSPQSDPTRAVVSFDEKTGIQALERAALGTPMRPGQPQRQEFEYIRHGTLSLLSLMLVGTGQVFGVCSPQRTNPQTAAILALLIGLLFTQGINRITVILDQLNTHMSYDMVQAIAKLCELPCPDEELLDTMLKRRAWLENPEHPIHFLFTPKHASWLNPIERWFGLLSRRLLRRGHFRNLEELDARIQAFILYFNERLAHPYKLRRWTPGQSQQARSQARQPRRAAA
jgi:transposase